MKKLLTIEVDVASEAELASMKATLDKFGFRFVAAKEINEAMTGFSPLAGPFIKKMVYKRNANPFG